MKKLSGLDPETETLYICWRCTHFEGNKNKKICETYEELNVICLDAFILGQSCTRLTPSFCPTYKVLHMLLFVVKNKEDRVSKLQHRSKCTPPQPNIYTSTQGTCTRSHSNMVNVLGFCRSVLTTCIMLLLISNTTLGDLQRYYYAHCSQWRRHNQHKWY